MYSDTINHSVPSLQSRLVIPNSHEQAAESVYLDWAKQFELGSNQHDLAQIARIHCGSCAAHVYPRGSKDLIEFGAKLIAWQFLFDDLYGEGENACDMRDMIQNFSSFEDVIRTGYLMDKPTNLHVALKDIREEGLRISEHNDIWFERFVSSFRSYLNGCLLEFEFRHFKAVPSLETYRRLRAWSIGVYPVFSPIELGICRLLTNQEYTDKRVKTVQERAALLCAWINDIYSFPKEREAGDCLNLVAILANQNSLSWEKAFRLAVEVYNNDLIEFKKECSEISNFSAAVHEYAEALDDWVQGSLAWTRICGRYA